MSLEFPTPVSYEELIENIISDPSSFNLPQTAAVVAMFLKDFRPVNPPVPGGDNLTSFEIVQVLEDICGLSTQDVALTMTALGYRLAVNELKGLEWSMTTLV